MKRFLSILTCSLLFASCGFFGGSDEPEVPDVVPPPKKAEEPVEPEPTERETQNVSFEGILETAGISIYQEGTHKIMLDDTRFILLESDVLTLEDHVGAMVSAFGSVRPTVEDGGQIMRVETMEILAPADDPALAPDEIAGTGETVQPAADNPEMGTGEVLDTENQEEDNVPPNEGEESPEETIPEPTASDDAEESEDTIPESPGEDEVIPEPLPEDGADAPSDTLEEGDAEDPTGEEMGDVIFEQEPLSPELEATVMDMQKENYASERWTRNYCSSHIGFCIPVHKNWWYKSFGNTTSHLWHVELSNQELDNLGDGAIQVLLVSGSVGSKKATDGQVRTHGTSIIGFRAWDSSQHFEIIADQRLEAAVRYLTQHLKTFSE